ncbi:hypothetical protein [Criblamydia sequanensis]|uniref:Uncharacterized protein n=1 Tax=Candidatus Criblamydia sequanensis CRIB-18 TaxID=1437425 RepID=A0A090DX61_9BACT|nr:hypothetical protein [Criblamydia sequanensis]CDR33419.1 hypothetical protein CSEC_0586 [Criblamydia sequanensis CRIB-18]
MSASIAQKIVDLEVLIQEKKNFIKASKLKPTDSKELQQSKNLVDQSITDLWILYSFLFDEVFKRKETYRRAIREDRKNNKERNLINKHFDESVVSKLSERVSFITKDSKKFEREVKRLEGYYQVKKEQIIKNEVEKFEQLIQGLVDGVKATSKGFIQKNWVNYNFKNFVPKVKELFFDYLVEINSRQRNEHCLRKKEFLLRAELNGQLAQYHLSTKKEIILKSLAVKKNLLKLLEKFSQKINKLEIKYFRSEILRKEPNLLIIETDYSEDELEDTLNQTEGLSNEEENHSSLEAREALPALEDSSEKTSSLTEEENLSLITNAPPPPPPPMMAAPLSKEEKMKLEEEKRLKKLEAKEKKIRDLESEITILNLQIEEMQASFEQVTELRRTLQKNFTSLDKEFNSLEKLAKNDVSFKNKQSLQREIQTNKEKEAELNNLLISIQKSIDHLEMVLGEKECSEVEVLQKGNLVLLPREKAVLLLAQGNSELEAKKILLENLLEKRANLEEANFLIDQKNIKGNSSSIGEFEAKFSEVRRARAEVEIEQNKSSSVKDELAKELKS